MKTRRLLLLLWISFALTGLAVPETDKLTRIYKNELSRLASEYQAERIHAPQDHVAAMRALESGYQQSGELKSLLAVRKERKRFVGNPSPSKMKLVSTPAHLRAIQEAYISQSQSISGDHKRKTSELKAKYLQAMENLKKDLTRQGKIQSALAVMNEIEAVNSGQGDVDSHAVSGVVSPTPTRPNSYSSGDILDIEALGKRLHGEVMRWNSHSRQITIRYDFSDAEQIQNWKGGEWDQTHSALVCTRTVAWAKTHFLLVQEIEINALFEGSEQHAGIVIGDSLQAHLTNGDALQATLFQTSKEYPLSSFTVSNGKNLTMHHCKLALKSGRIEWSVDNSRIRRAILESQIRYPTYVGFGHMGATSAYDNITITGILSKEYVDYLKKQL